MLRMGDHAADRRGDALPLSCSTGGEQTAVRGYMARDLWWLMLMALLMGAAAEMAPGAAA